ncbi:MAG: hypothetical protein COW55_10850 [Rhodobacteraceae bacterium CG17_big_fil_post_rev_8_21_14_2_50_65_11]|nr:MAG: hypothetical protein COW55_10850 [Rhodobacteraceae bacterium CG17_big_fil_post_rev_8_21_14_2_50_65_11]
MTRFLFSVVCLLTGTMMASAASLPVADHTRADQADQKTVGHSVASAVGGLKPRFQPFEAGTSARDAAIVMPETLGFLLKK